MNNKKGLLAARLLSYLEKNLEAGDTLEGIAGWWLVQERIEHVVDEVADALETLVAEGQVTKIKKGPGQNIYKCNQSPKDPV